MTRGRRHARGDAGTSVLLVTNMLTWQTGIAERAAWDVFVRYGGLSPGQVLKNRIDGRIRGVEWPADLGGAVALVLILR